MSLSIETIFFSSVLVREKMIEMILSIWVWEGICWISMVRNQKCTARTCNTRITSLQEKRITFYEDIKPKWIGYILRRIMFRWIVFPFKVSVWFVMGVVNCLSYILKARNKWKKLIQFILFWFRFHFILYFISLTFVCFLFWFIFWSIVDSPMIW